MTTTRFAPSPTGALHLGNLRTAALNALVARAAGGRFLLRIDDTDAARSEARFEAAIREDLRWLGIAWDGEARQSERIAVYEAAAERLRAAGRLYPCWETESELALMRRALLNAKKPPVYDRAALALSEARKAELMAQRRPHWRFRLDDTAMEWEDGILGPQRIAAGAVSDPVLIREDGQFLYTLCSVVDDAELGVTDVVRGADHVTNTATQIQIFEALGARPPRFAHHALMTGPGGEKLSKRAGALSAAALREAGAEPAAVLSWLARSGSSRPVEPVWSVDEAASVFDLSVFSPAPSQAREDEILQLSARMLREAPWRAVKDRAPEGVTEAFFLAVRPNLDRLEEAADWLRVAKGAPAIIAPEDSEFVAEALALLPAQPWNETTWRAWTDAVKARTGRKGKALFLPLRRVLTGRSHGPDMGAFMPFLER